MTATPVLPPILVAVDGNNLLHRAYHAHKRRAAGDGSGPPVAALCGFASLLQRAVDTIGTEFRAPAAITVMFDGPKPLCRRRLRDPGYKASRSVPDAALAAQLEVAPDWLRDCGLPVHVFDGFEADDGCASAATAAAALGWRCVVVTSDRDAFSLLSPSVRVARPINGGGFSVIGSRWLADRYGLPDAPGVYGEFAALRGDPADDLAGVPGVGDKTAAAIVSAVHQVGCRIADVYRGDPTAVGALSARQHRLLLAAPDVFARNTDLMVPVTDLAVPVPPRALSAGRVVEGCRRWQTGPAVSALAGTLRRLQPVG